jgi:hypothetical protein
LFSDCWARFKQFLFAQTCHFNNFIYFHPHLFELFISLNAVSNKSMFRYHTENII